MDPVSPINSSAPTLLFNSGETKFSIELGKLNTFYDPDLFTQNNPFCYLGFQNGLNITLDE